MNENEFHPVANIFPMMGENELTQLAEDIKEHGLREPIWRHRDGRIIDGRNRYLACERAGVPCHAHTFEGDDSELVAFVVSHNLHRRHLTESQRGAVGANIANLDRGAFHGNQYTSGMDQKTHTNSPQPITNAAAAKLMNVAEPTVKRARRIKREAPEMFEKIEKGEMKIGEALRKLPSVKSSAPKNPHVTAPVGQLRVVHDRDDQIAEQICMLCNRLREVADKITPEGVYPKLIANERFVNNLTRSLDEAYFFLAELHRRWANDRLKKNAAG